MANYQYDVVVIGAGSTGLAAAFSLQAAGKKVVIIEKYLWGGTCPNYGCDPKKILLTAVETVDRQRRLANAGVSGHLSINWTMLQTHRAEYVQRVEPRKLAGLDRAGIEHFHGTAEFIDQNNIELSTGDHIMFDTAVIAVGQRPKTLDFPGGHLALDNQAFLQIERLPTSALFIGAGYVGLEFATIMATAGVKTYVVSRGNRALRSFDQELVDDVISDLTEKQVEFLFNREVVRIAESNQQYQVSLSDGSEIIVDAVFNAAGHVGNADLLRTENTDVKLNDLNDVIVDDHLRAGANIYAVGDVAEAGVPKLIPTGTFQGRYVAAQILGNSNKAIEYPTIAPVAFTSPKIAYAGKSTDDPNAKRYDMSKVITFYRSNDHAIIKTILDKNGVIIGASVKSEMAEELINYFVMAINERQTFKDSLKVIYSYPSLGSDMPEYLEKP
jgi:glutathione reductase (NADPH)